MFTSLQVDNQNELVIVFEFCPLHFKSMSEPEWRREKQSLKIKVRAVKLSCIRRNSSKFNECDKSFILLGNWTESFKVALLLFYLMSCQN